ncbi:carboxypeptidase-like regulatory domain-containing protein [Maribacter halichondriae]|uniref:carboxypeptidase-like regulatory domain-containing protein n=1 Tax=Maribacter halichondriae TaxID=2980554 RepID=UPI0023596BCA|nr:carboxypeptidase-like regulatory domain-containing protein [Maribacter sp. Hal144]
MRNLTFCIFVLFFLLGSGIRLLAQENEYLYGRVLEEETGAPVVFASVQIKGRTKGVITNQDGGFRLPFALLSSGESIDISSMGYEKKTVAIKDLSLDETNIIYLSTGVFSLTETVVTAKRKGRLTAKRIVSNAIENIPNNYPSGNFTLKGYYRDYQLDSLAYVNLNEALLEVFDSGFDEIDSTSTKTRLYEYLQNESFRRDTIADNPYNYKEHLKTIDNAYLNAYGGNEFAILRIHDAIRNYRINSYDFVNTMKEGDILKNHSFKRLPDTYLEDEPLYTIQLKKEHPKYSVRGILYISQNDFAIHKLEYAVYDEKKRNTDEKLRDQGIKGELIFEVSTEYKRLADYKMYLNYISLHNTFQLTIPPKFIIKETLVSAPTNTFIITLNNKLATKPDAEKAIGTILNTWAKN